MVDYCFEEGGNSLGTIPSCLISASTPSEWKLDSQNLSWGNKAPLHLGGCPNNICFEKIGYTAKFEGQKTTNFVGCISELRIQGMVRISIILVYLIFNSYVCTLELTYLLP